MLDKRDQTLVYIWEYQKCFNESPSADLLAALVGVCDEKLRQIILNLSGRGLISGLNVTNRGKNMAVKFQWAN